MNDDDDDNDWESKSDLTRIEDLSEFLHQEDPEVDAQLEAGAELESSTEQAPPPSQETTLPDLPLPEELPSDELSELNDIEEDFAEAQEIQQEDDFDFDSPPDEGDFTSNDEDDFTSHDEGNFDFPSGDDFTPPQESDFDSPPESDFDSPPESDFESPPESDFESPPESDFESPVEDDFDSSEDISPQQEAEEESFSPAPVSSPPPPSQRENFQDLRDFGNAITYGVVTTGGNPPYSLILRGIRYQEDAEDIKILLREHDLLTDDNEGTIDQGLEQGSLLISQVSEYSAIYLAHKMRRFDVDIRIGLSDQLHPSQSYAREGRGLISKSNLRQNKEESMEIEDYALDIDDIKMVTASQIEGHSIKRYIEIISAHSLVKEADLYQHIFQKGRDSEDDPLLRNLLDQFPEDIQENPVKDLGLNQVYQLLVEELKNEAFKIEANAVLGINFSLTPINTSSESPQTPRYKITATGNAVWIIDQPY